MAIVLWKGNEFKICNENSFTQELEDGWFLSKAKAKADADAKIEAKKKPEVKAEVKKSSNKG